MIWGHENEAVRETEQGAFRRLLIVVLCAAVFVALIAWSQGMRWWTARDAVHEGHLGFRAIHACTAELPQKADVAHQWIAEYGCYMALDQ